MKVERVPIDSLVLDPANPRLHPEKNLEAIKGSLARFGQRGGPLVVRGGVVIVGNGRLQAAKALGWKEIDIVRADDLSPTEAAALSIADNRTSELALWDEEELQRTLDALAKDTEINLASVGFFEDDIRRLAESIEERLPVKSEELDDEEENEDNLDLLFKAPFPWFGGKARIARQVWRRFGDVRGYIEPFFGSGAVLLNRPQPFEGVETVNDLDGFVCNAWRAIQKEPEAVAKFADWPAIENDAHARHVWLVSQKDSLQARLEGDPEWCDSKIAGWWLWGMALWIGSGFCAGNGPWGIEEDESGTRKLVQLGNSGQGVQRQRVAEGAGGIAGRGEHGLLPWIEALSDRLRRVRVCCGDWTRVCGGEDGDALSHFFGAGEPAGIFLDPPYSAEADRDPRCYRTDDLKVAHAVRDWAVRHGEDPRLRIALCGYEGEHEMPESWTKVSWKAHGGMANLGENQGKKNRFRERVWFSKHCLTPSS